MVGILPGLPEIWIQLYSVWEMIDCIAFANIRHCIEEGIYFTVQLEPMKSKVYKQPFKMCIACSESSRASRRFGYSYRVSGRWLILHPLQTLDIALNKEYTVQSETMKPKHLRSAMTLEGCAYHVRNPPRPPRDLDTTVLYSVRVMIDFTPSANIGHCIEHRNYEAEVSKKCYEACRMCLAC